MQFYSYPKTLDLIPLDNVTVVIGSSVLVDNQPVADIDKVEIDAAEDFKTSLDFKQKKRYRLE